MALLKKNNFILSAIFLVFFVNCSGTDDPEPIDLPEEPTETSTFYFGADLSYVNQILDKGGVYLNEGVAEDPYTTFGKKGANLARFRLWHNPAWTKEVYGGSGTQLYNDLLDVEKSIRLAKAQGMEVLLDFHYSDDWADPENQKIPAAWMDITNISVLADSVYQYTFNTLSYLEEKGLMPEMIQVGNETNCGMLFSNAPAAFPSCNVCDDGWSNMQQVVNSAIAAIRKVAETSDIEPKVILHVADPKNVKWWFDNITKNNVVSDFDIIGFSYYPIWHTQVSLPQLKSTIAGFKSTFNKDVMILEVAYPWITEGNDSYNNLFGGSGMVSGYPFTLEGHKNIMKDITQSVVDGGGIGVIYWEPAWVTSQLKDRWGTGSSWENNAFYDYKGNANQGFDFMDLDYGLDD
ncbi:glycosyl hydrolase 53 family protein [Flammeovirgaceae bacterium SG7u.111]|nr:glycosyl hydrolase 53 family protein [Flammeovirgaceae bacterium SG7u.132]WPO33679.1 glycosyl hydrolase 53 family protein [Flammeovirgaceae bacterium SG7u.111]